MRIALRRPSKSVPNIVETMERGMSDNRVSQGGDCRGSGVEMKAPKLALYGYCGARCDRGEHRLRDHDHSTLHVSNAMLATCGMPAGGKPSAGIVTITTEAAR